MARVRNSAWVQLDGELEFATAADAEAAIVSATALMRSVTIDLRGLEFIDSSGMALLVRASRRARQLGVTLTVIAGAGPVTQLLRTCGIDRQIALMEAGDALPRATA
jgi:anti-anti-sigma factor